MAFRLDPHIGGLVLHVVLDSNIWLSFYSVTDDTLDQLRKLEDEVRANRLKLLLPSQVADEVERNRELVIDRSLSELKKLVIPKPSLPRAVEHYEEHAALRTARDTYEANRLSIERKFRNDATSRLLPADEVIGALLAVAERIESHDEILSLAQLRVSRGNPPGKSGSVGDAIIWESLLWAVPESEDLHLVAADGDFRSRLDTTAANPFLVREWSEQKDASLLYYRSIGAFTQAHIPTLTLSEPPEPPVAAEAREEPDDLYFPSPLVLALLTSSSFSATHFAIKQLHGQEFSDDELQLLVRALANPQVGGILTDTDVQAFYSNLFSRDGHRLSKADHSTLQSQLMDAFLNF